MPDHSLIHRNRPNSKFSILDNTLLQDPEISAEAQMVATYLLSLPEDWRVCPKQIWRAKNISRDKVYNAIDELCDLGYMKKVEKFRGNLRSGFQYHLSAFKEFLRRPEPQEPELGDPEDQELLSNKGEKEIKDNNKEAPPEAASRRHSEEVKEGKESTPEQHEPKDRLDELKLEKAHISRLRAKHTKDDLNLAVSRVLRWKGRSNDSVGIETALKDKDIWVDRKDEQEIIESNQRFYEQFTRACDGKTLGSFKIQCNRHQISFTKGSYEKTFYMNEEGFEDQVREFYKKIKSSEGF